MNNKGFTLIEVLAVLVILSFIMGLALPAFTSSLEKSKKREEEIKRDKIMAAAEMYVTDYKYDLFNNSSRCDTINGSKQCDISLEELKSKGYLSQAEVKDEFGGVVYSPSSSDNKFRFRNADYDSEIDYFSENYSEDNDIRNFKVGDYVEYTSSTDSYTLDSSTTGYSKTQIIHPSKLNLWRIIKKNDDGTLEMISVNASNETVYFKGITGYKYLIRNLNAIAVKYKNSGYTVGSRYFGYSNQVQHFSRDIVPIGCRDDYCKFTKVDDCSVNGMDDGHQADTDLVKSVFGDLKVANNLKYWVASRDYLQVTNSRKEIITDGNGVVINVTREKICEQYAVAGKIVKNDGKYYTNNNTSNNPSITGYYLYAKCNTENTSCCRIKGSERGAHLRPIVILKSGLKCKLKGANTATNACKIFKD